MCYDDSARPPLPLVSGGSGGLGSGQGVAQLTQDLRLTEDEGVGSQLLRNQHAAMCVLELGLRDLLPEK